MKNSHVIKFYRLYLRKLHNTYCYYHYHYFFLLCYMYIYILFFRNFKILKDKKWLLICIDISIIRNVLMGIANIFYLYYEKHKKFYTSN